MTEHLLAIVSSMKTNKAVGHVLIRSRVFKANKAVITITLLIALYNKIFSLGKTSKRLKTTVKNEMVKIENSLGEKQLIKQSMPQGNILGPHCIILM